MIESGSTSLESHFLARPLVFSTVPFCQGDCGSQNQVAELRPTVEGDRAACAVGQGLKRADEALHDRPRLPVVVAQENSKTADPLDQRRHVRLAELLAELDEVAFPVSELLAIGDHVRSALDVEIRAEALAMPAPGMPRPASGTVFRQVFPKLDGVTIRRIGELVDRLVADRDRVALQSHTAGDLLQRPAVQDPLDDGLADMQEAGKLPELGPTLARHVMRRHAMVATELWPFLVGIDVTPYLAENRRSMASKLLRK